MGLALIWHPASSAQCRPPTAGGFAWPSCVKRAAAHPVSAENLVGGLIGETPGSPAAGLPAGAVCASRQLAGRCRGRGRGGCCGSVLFVPRQLIKLAAVSSTTTTIWADGRANPHQPGGPGGVEPASPLGPAPWRATVEQPSLDLQLLVIARKARRPNGLGQQRLRTRSSSAASTWPATAISTACRDGALFDQAHARARLRL